MSVNLAPAVRAVLALMDDECTITRDAQGVADDTWDDVTGTYTKPTPDTGEVYAGVCLLTPTPLGGRPTQAGAVEDPGNREYQLRVPLEVDVSDSTVVKIGDVVTIITSKRDPVLTGRTFTVVGSVAQTFAVCRQLDVRGPR